MGAHLGSRARRTPCPQKVQPNLKSRSHPPPSNCGGAPASRRALVVERPALALGAGGWLESCSKGQRTGVPSDVLGCVA